jgi:hypothetical protein
MSKKKSDPASATLDNRANQLNPEHPAYYRSRGVPPTKATERAAHARSALDNRSRQLNPSDERYRQSRGESGNGGKDR